MQNSKLLKNTAVLGKIGKHFSTGSEFVWWGAEGRWLDAIMFPVQEPGPASQVTVTAVQPPSALGTTSSLKGWLCGCSQVLGGLPSAWSRSPGCLQPHQATQQPWHGFLLLEGSVGPAVAATRAEPLGCFLLLFLVVCWLTCHHGNLSPLCVSGAPTTCFPPPPYLACSTCEAAPAREWHPHLAFCCIPVEALAVHLETWAEQKWCFQEGRTLQNSGLLGLMLSTLCWVLQPRGHWIQVCSGSSTDPKVSGSSEEGQVNGILGSPFTFTTAIWSNLCEAHGPSLEGSSCPAQPGGQTGAVDSCCLVPPALWKPGVEHPSPELLGEES